MTTEAPSTAETPADFGSDDAAIASRWISELGLSEKDQNSWSVRAKKIIARYKEQRADVDTGKRRFAILWANIQTLGPAVYARTPQPVVSRRFKDEDPVGRVSSEVLERALSFSCEAYDLDAVLRQCRDEFLLLARGQAWVRYEPHFHTVRTPVEPVVAEVADDGAQVTDTVESEAAEPEAFMDAAGQRHEPDQVKADDNGHYIEEQQLHYEEVVCDHVSWDDFGTNPARTWAEVRFVWRRAYMTREELRKRFTKPVPNMPGKTVGDLVPLDCSTATDTDATGADKDQQFKKAAVYEIWDKNSGKAYWISKEFATAPLDVRDDPLSLSEFFPCPRPLLGTTAPDSLIPIPDYAYYQDQAEELDDVTKRIGGLVKALRLNGFYAGQHDSKLQTLFKDGQENQLIPVEDWAALKGDGGLRGVIEWVPVEQVAAVLTQCYQTRERILQDIYQLTGISDIVRGASDPNETATAQGIKAQWGSLRVRDRQQELARFARDLIRIKGEIIAEKFTVDTLKQMTGVQLFDTPEQKALEQQKAQMAAQQGQPVPPDLERLLAAPTWQEVKALLENDALRQFRIEIETDSTVEPNEQEEKQRRVEFVTALGSLIGQALPAVQAAPQLMPLIGESLKFVARGFRAGREMEDIIDKVSGQIAAMPPPQAQQPAAPPPPDPAQQAEQNAKSMTAQARVIDAQTNAQRAQTEAQLGAADLHLRAAALARDPTPQAYEGAR